MKQILHLSIILLLAASCRKDQIHTYSGGSYIQFSKIYTDSSLFSFLALPPGQDAATVALPVELTGSPSGKDRTYKIVVDKSFSTATDANYTLPATFTLKAGMIKDTALVTVRRTPDLSVQPSRLVFRIQATDDLQPGQTEYTVSILHLSNIIAQPDWWNDYVTGYFLGNYSDKKYKLFIQVTGMANLDPDDDSQLRYYTILFKNYLLKEKDAGRTVFENDGTEMTVALIGG